MILYQLESGKAVWISTDTLLNLTHQGIQDLEASSSGSHCNNPFIKLPTSSSEFKKQFTEDDDDEEDESPDMQSDGDDISYGD